MTARDVVAAALLVGGAFFFFAGTVALVRFPDVYTRLHSLSKADNVGLGLVVLGMVVETPSIATAAKLVLTWALVLASSSISSQLIARWAIENGIQPWRRP